MSFANRFGKGLLASLENEQDVVAEEVVETADNAEADLAEAAEVEVELAETTDAIDEGAEDAETLEEIADVLEETEQEGGADPVTAQVAEVAVEAIYKRLGLAKAKPLAHGLESFSDKATRLDATRLSVEGIRETAKRVWEAIYAMLMKIKDFLVRIYKAIFDSHTKLINRAEKIKKVAQEATAGATKEKEVTGNFIRALANGDRFDKAYALKSVDSLEQYAKDTAIIVNAAGRFGEVFKVKELVADKAKYESFTGPSVKESSNLKTLSQKAKKYMGLKEDGDSVWLALNENTMGSTTVAVKVAKTGAKGEALMRAIGDMQVKVMPVSDKEISKDAKAPVLTGPEIVALCDSVIEGLKAFEGQKAAMTVSTKGLDNLVKEAKATAAESKEDKEAAERSKVVSKAVRAYGTYVGAVSSQTLKHSAIIARAGLDYAQKSMAAYSTAEAAA